jgi:hypothetical protein
MLKTFVASVALAATVSVACGQAPDPQVEGARQVVGLFASTCIRFAGNVAGLRVFMTERHVPELTSDGRAIFLRGRHGVGFDATNKVTRLALISEDNGVCSAFADRADKMRSVELIEAVVKRQGIAVTKRSDQESGAAHSHVYELIIGNKPFTLVFSTNPNSGATIQIALTLAPKM